MAEDEIRHHFEQTYRSHSLDTYAQKFFDATKCDATEDFIGWIASTSPNNNFCDFGCGEGKAISELMINLPDFNVSGVEKYPSHVFAENIHEGDFSHIPFPDDFFGSGVSNAALGSYAEDELELHDHFKELYRVLSPGAGILLSPFNSLQKVVSDNGEIANLAGIPISRLSDREFCIQKPSMGNLGAPDTTNSFQCKLLKVALDCGFEGRVMHAYIGGSFGRLPPEIYITGVELRVQK